MITQVEREPLDRFQQAVDYGKVYYRQAGNYIYAVGKHDDVHAVLEILWPFLCERKRLQANAAIDFVNERRAA